MKMSDPSNPNIEKAGSVTIVTLGEEYDSLHGELLEKATSILLETAQNAAPPIVVLDLSNTKFFGSAFIEVLVRVWNVLEERGEGQFAVCGLNPHCAEVIEVTHLNEVWKVFPDREAAIVAMEA